MSKPRELKKDIALFFYFLKEARRYSRWFLPVSAAIMVVQALRPFLLAYLPSLLIDELTQGRRAAAIIAYAAAVVAGEGVLGILTQELQKRQNVESMKVNRQMEMNVSLAMADVPYAKLEDKEFLDFRQTYLSGLSRSMRIAHVMIRAFHIGTCLLALGGYALLLIRLLVTDKAGIPSGVKAVDLLVSNTWIWLFAIAGMSLYSSYLKVKSDNVYMKMVEEFAPTERAYAYYQKLSRNQVCAKDIRLFRFYPLLSAYMEDYRKAARKLDIRFSNATLIRTAPADICLKVQTLLIYILVAMKVYVKMITFGQFYMYANAIRNTIAALSEMLDDITDIRYAFGFHYAYQVLVEEGAACAGGRMEGAVVQTGKCDAPAEATFRSLEFEDVWFRYPGSETWVLQGFSGRIEAGQRVSIVGMNGAGKTTLIKLLHRFYQPERGRILLNGIDISSYPYEAYWRMFSTVFQDVHYFAYSVGENVAAAADMDSGRVDEVLGEVGLTEMLSRHKGHDTELTREFSEEGVIMSGGEAQKLAVARALYRDAPIYVFDEPTAALDPLAEKEIVDCFDGCTQGRTVIYISHRMASCRDSDRIFVVDKGRLAECGTHEQLVGAKGIYWQLWSAQAQWYVRK